MEELKTASMQNIATGVQTYNFNGMVEVSFNPTDQNFIERLHNTFERLEQKQDTYRAEIERAKGTKAIFEVAHARSDEMRGMIDELFQQPVCEPLFGSMNLYSMADGLPVWVNLMMAVVDICDANLTEQEKQGSPRLQKFLTKYKKYRK